MPQVSSLKSCFIALQLIVLSSLVAVAANPSKDAVSVTKTASGVEMSLPVAKLVLKVPGAGFEPYSGIPAQGPTASPRYFYVTNKTSGVNMSGWIEPRRAYKGFKTLWETDKANLEKRGTKVSNEEQRKVGNWDVMFYTTELSNNFIQTHLRACCVHNGAWFDLHLSRVDRSPNFAPLEEVLGKSIIEQLPDPTK